MGDGAASNDPGTGAPATGDRSSADARLVRRVGWRLAAWSGGATLLVLLVLGSLIYVAVRDSLAATGTAQLDERAQLVEEFLATSGQLLELPPLELYFGGRGSGTFAFLAPRGLDPLRPEDFDPPTGPDEAGIAAAWIHGRDVREAVADGVAWRFLSLQGSEELRVSGLPIGLDYVIQVVQDRSAEVRALDTLLLVLGAGGLVALLVAIGVGALYAQRALVPIRQALLGRRLALQRQREFAADASHELRTPLTVVRTSVDHLRLHASRPVGEVGNALDDIDAEVDHLSALVDDLLLLARADSDALDLSIAPVELGDLATEVSAMLASPAAVRGVRVQVDPEPVIVHGDPVRLRQLVTILVDNAVRHSPPAGVVEVAVRRREGAAVLTVADQGPGIAPADLPRVFDRFWRAAGENPGGTGLGLSIAAAIVTRHAGRIGAANRVGGGAAFTVVLPAAGGG
jgi:signal transduction histidine kinase